MEHIRFTPPWGNFPHMPNVKWFDNGCAGVLCVCGTEVIVGDEITTCSKCGNRYTLVQRVLLEKPFGTCLNCGKFIYKRRPGSKYCNEKCGVEYRLRQKSA